jgi:hypothetical protein
VQAMESSRETINALALIFLSLSLSLLLFPRVALAHARFLNLPTAVSVCVCVAFFFSLALNYRGLDFALKAAARRLLYRPCACAPQPFMRLNM